ncbi:HalOD1 output domain-containing protein [Halorubellus sp. PRR65]|uniref:HalOD1 output domain-containing protein n=1 Tax=Halorubellus sp. PRR65 TaxID=3098148 RepID=UPI002B257727|nr:HalOD1 output domain-containing protein [Halorubellus sp. PRR65]
MSHTTQPTTATERYHTTWDDTTSLHDSVAETVATATDSARSVVEDEYDRAHARSIRDLFDAETTAVPSTGVVKFVVAACTVSVHSDGRLVVDPPDGPHHDTTT